MAEQVRDFKGMRLYVDVPQTNETPLKIEIDSLDGLLIYSIPMVGPGKFTQVMSEVNKRGARATTRQNLILAERILACKDEKHFVNFYSTLRNNWYWNSTRSGVFNQGAFVFDDTQGEMPDSIDRLARLSFDKTSGIRFIEPGFETGEMEIQEFLKNPRVLAEVGSDDYIKDVLKRVAFACHKKRAYINALASSEKDIFNHSALCSFRNDGRLSLDCVSDEGDRDGYAFPVSLASTEGAKPA